MARYSAEEMDELPAYATDDDITKLCRQAAHRERAWEQLRARLEAAAKHGLAQFVDANNGPLVRDEAASRAHAYKWVMAEMSRLDAEPEGE